MKVLVTGCAGFIGYHVAEALLARGDAVVGLDNLNDYYDVRLKQARLDRLRQQAGFAFRRLDVSDGTAVHASSPRTPTSTGSCISPRRQASGIRWWIPMPTCSRT